MFGQISLKALMISNSSYHRNFQTKTDMRVKICFYAKLCTQNRILASKMQQLKQQNTSAFDDVKRTFFDAFGSKLFDSYGVGSFLASKSCNDFLPSNFLPFSNSAGIV